MPMYQLSFKAESVFSGHVHGNLEKVPLNEATLVHLNAKEMKEYCSIQNTSSYIFISSVLWENAMSHRSKQANVHSVYFTFFHAPEVISFFKMSISWKDR